MSYENFDPKNRRTRMLVQVHREGCDREYCSCPQKPAEAGDADLICSDVVDSSPYSKTAHKPVIDFDIPVRLVPSGTPGHSHLYIDKGCSWDQFKRVLDALVAAGFVEDGYRSASVERGYTAVRHPARPKLSAA